MKLAICTPTVRRPHDAYLASLEAAVPALDAAGIEHATVNEVGNPYISAARAVMIRKALDWGADTVVCIDHDVSFRPDDLVKLVTTEGDVVAGTYRYKCDEVQYMGALIEDAHGRPQVRKSDGAVLAYAVPAGFLKITLAGIRKIMRAHPELLMGRPEAPAVDLFHHGAHEWVWYGEDMAFSRRWRALGDIWLVPDLDLDHWSFDGTVFRGNYHRYLLELAPPVLTCRECGKPQPTPGNTILGHWVCDECYYPRRAA